MKSTNIAKIALLSILLLAGGCSIRSSEDSDNRYVLIPGEGDRPSVLLDKKTGCMRAWVIETYVVAGIKTSIGTLQIIPHLQLDARSSAVPTKPNACSYVED